MYMDLDLHGVRVVKYIRCSTEQQVEFGETLEAQNEILDEFIAKNHMVLIDTFVDEGLTGRKKLERRKEFNRLLQGVKNQEFDLIIFTKLERWFRNVRDYQNTQAILDKYGVQWKAVTEQYDTTTSNGRLYVNIRMAVAQDECDRVSERIKDVFHYKLQNKVYINGNLPVGLKLDPEKRVVFDKETMQIPLDLFDFFEQTGSKRKALKLVNEKYNTSYSYHWCDYNLKNKIFKGEFKGIPEFCPALIEPDRFDRLQRIASHNVRERNGKVHIFAGILSCPLCSSRMIASTKHRKRKDGTWKHEDRYRCSRRNASMLCDFSKTYSEKFLEECFLSSIRPAMEKYVFEYDVTEEKNRTSTSSVQKIKQKLRKLYELYMDDMIDRELYSNEYKKLQNQLSESIDTVPKSKDTAYIKEMLNQDWESNYKNLSSEEKTAFWRSIIETAVVYEDGNIEIIFR